MKVERMREERMKGVRIDEAYLIMEMERSGWHSRNLFLSLNWR